MVRSIESTITQVTGTTFRFRVKNYPNVALKVNWGDRELSFNVLPDGLRSIIGWMVHALVTMDVWLQGKGPSATASIFLLDEIESHLHPAWQRKILPAFQALFPKAQIFVATHSPFVIASLNYGWIHSLKMNESRTVSVSEPIEASAGDSYVTVVEDIMGLKEWFDPDTEKMLTDFRAARDLAYRGDEEAQKRARDLGMQIGKRSTELDFMMGKRTHPDGSATREANKAGMRRFERGPAPDFLEQNCEEWGVEWEQRHLSNTKSTFNWRTQEGKPVNQVLLPFLKAQTQYHCSFCDNFPVSPPSIDTIEHFRPKATFPRDAYRWSKLVFCCMHCQQKNKNFDEKLLRLDQLNDEFSRVL